jgi:hypothetical protein
MERMKLLPKLDVTLVVPVLALFQALLEVNISIGGKLEAGLHVTLGLLQAVPEAVLQLA